MNNIYFSSDNHFNHNQPFLFGPRGFETIEEMNEAIINNFNSVVDNDDDLYLLGDIIMGELEPGIEWVKKLNGRIHIICGNHDTTNRIEAYKNLPNVVEICEVGTIIKYRKWTFYLTHFPLLVNNFEEKRKLWNLHGHTHSQDKFQFARNCAYNVACDAHNCKPIAIEDVINDIKEFAAASLEVEVEQA